MIGNPSLESRPYSPDPIPQHQASTTSAESPTAGIQPNLGYATAPFNKHPDFPQAVELLLAKWWDKQPSTYSSRINLYSHGKRVAILTPPEIAQKLRLDVLVNLDDFQAEQDSNWQFFENLLLANLALYAGSQEKMEEETREYPLPPFSTLLATNTFTPDALTNLTTHWHGKQEVIYTTRDKDGKTTQHRHGSFELIEDTDKELRLAIITAEKILSLDGTEVARVVTHYTPQPSNEVPSADDDSAMPLPVFSLPEVLVTGSTEEERYHHLELIISLLTKYQRELHTSQVKDRSTDSTLPQVAVFSHSSVEPTPSLASD